jgi:hypothetical protein
VLQSGEVSLIDGIRLALDWSAERSLDVSLGWRGRLLESSSAGCRKFREIGR